MDETRGPNIPIFCHPYPDQIRGKAVHATPCQYIGRIKSLAVALAFIGLLPLTVSCSSTREIVTSPPRSGIQDGTQESAGERQAPLEIILETGTSRLPEEVLSLRFRVAEVWLLQRGEAWVRIPSDLNLFEITGNGRPRKTVLSTLVPPAVYDSVGLTFKEVFVLFGENAGGPLTMARDEPLRLPVQVEPGPEAVSTVTLTFEPGPSVYRDAACRWYLLPMVAASVSPGQGE